MPDWFMEIKLPVLLGLGTVFGFLWLIRFRNLLNIGYITAFFLSLLNTILGVLSVKIFAFLEGVPGGMSLFGGVFFMPIYYLIGAKLMKRKLADVFDVFAVCTIITVMFARVNCLLSGCCGGTLIPGLNGLRWPTQWIEIIFYLVLIAFFWKKVGKEKYTGMIYPMYLLFYGCIRFVLEFVRQKDGTSMVHLSHAWAVVSILVGGAILGELWSRKMKKHERRRIK